MADEMDEPEAVHESGGLGDRLREAREQRGLTLEQIAAETRIPQRHLETIEAGRFVDLPARTYAIGFTKTYAKMMGFDEDEVVDQVREELDAQSGPGRHGHSGFEPGDPARVPTNGLVWLSVAALILLLVGGFFFLRILFFPAAELPSLVDQQNVEKAAELAEQKKAQAAAGANGSAADAGGVVEFTSLEDGVWVKFYDASGSQLMQKLMAKGEKYTVPAEADGPQIWTGRPDAFSITIGGKSVPKLAEDDIVMRDIPVTAEALLARPAPVTATSPTVAPAAAASASPTT